MPYPVIQDGTEAFGIPDSPVVINGVNYIAEDLSFTGDSNVVETLDENGVPKGQAFIPQNWVLSGRLQLATISTPIPPRGSTFTAEGIEWYVTSTGKAKSQGAYQTVPFGARAKIAV